MEDTTLVETPIEEKEKVLTGRPRKAIDWKIVDEMLYAGCLGTEIAAAFGIYPTTLYERCVDECRDEKGERYPTYTAYSQEKQSYGESILRRTQFAKANEGDTTMLIWLGKNRLGQRDHKEVYMANKEGETFKVEDIKNMAPLAVDEALHNELSEGITAEQTVQA